MKSAFPALALGAILSASGALAASRPPAIPASWRNIEPGWVVPDESYSTPPYIVKCDDGARLCVITTAAGKEGDHSQHSVGTRSTDSGRTWSSLINIEPPGPPEASYVTALKVPSGRIYVFYNYNGDRRTEVKKVDGGTTTRVDTLGHFVFKYSDDHSLTWSAKRHRIPIRETEVDRKNVYGGKVQFFWHVRRPLIHRGAAYVTLHKVGNFDYQFMIDTEGNFLRSDNLLTERDPRKIRWELLPEGDVGLRPPAGRIAEEQSIVALSDYTDFVEDQGRYFITYVRDQQKRSNPAFVGPGNPLGFSGGAAGVGITRTKNEAFKGVLYSDRFGDRVTSVVGVRHDTLSLNQIASGLNATGAVIRRSRRESSTMRRCATTSAVRATRTFTRRTWAGWRRAA